MLRGLASLRAAPAPFAAALLICGILLIIFGNTPLAVAGAVSLALAILTPFLTLPVSSTHPPENRPEQGGEAGKIAPAPTRRSELADRSRRHD